MKFGKGLKRQVEETLPEWRDKFLSYKDLKKILRLLSHPSSSAADADFLRLLDAEIDKFNSFYIEQEEDFIIRQKELQERIQNVIAMAGPTEAEFGAEMAMIRKDIVNFHGEMVLLENYSSINYTGLAKILKKYDKRTGGILRLPFIDKVLKQPFFTTDLVSKLVKDCESTMDSVFPVARSERRTDEAREAIPAVGAEQSIFRNTIAALVTMRDLRRGSSTVGHFSLPPLSPMDTLALQSLQLPSPVPIP